MEMKIGIIGLGKRGMGHLTEILCERDDVHVTYVCDSYEERCLAGVKAVETHNGNTPKWTQDYKQLIESNDVEVVIIASSWENHIPAAVYADYLIFQKRLPGWAVFFITSHIQQHNRNQSQCKRHKLAGQILFPK